MTCPICKKPASRRYRPFCSRTCADIDLGQWLSGGYALPSNEEPDDATEPSDTTEPRH